MYDAIIVGARCAGSATALLMARRGYKVLLVDRTSFPSDTISGHCVLHRGNVRLQRWGLLDKVIASNCPPITTISSNFGDFTLSGEVPLIENAPAAIGPRRTVLDTILVQAAVEAGVELRQNFVVTDLLADGDQVTGIRGHTQASAAVTERARIVIGGDGKHSKIAQLVQAPMYMEVPSLTCWYMSYWSDFPCDGLEIHWRHHHAIMILPTNDDLTLVAAAWRHSEFHQVRSDIEKYYHANAALMPEVADRLSGAKREEPFYGMADVPSFFRKPYGRGWALVGDAGHHKDPTPAYGISDAFCDAELLAEAIHQGLSGEQTLETTLAQYEQSRNQRAVPDHELTVQRALLEGWDAPEMLQLRAALRGNMEDTGHFFAMIAKANTEPEFFAPDNIQRIMQQANLNSVPQ